MSGSADCPLFLRPAKAVQAKRRPMRVRIAPGINLVLEPKQNEMAGVLRAEAGNFDVVTEQIRILRNFVHRAAEELFLIIEAWTPGEIRADLQVFAHAMANHVLGVDAF